MSFVRKIKLQAESSRRRELERALVNGGRPWLVPMGHCSSSSSSAPQQQQHEQERRCTPRIPWRSSFLRGTLSPLACRLAASRILMTRDAGGTRYEDGKEKKAFPVAVSLCVGVGCTPRPPSPSALKHHLGRGVAVRSKASNGSKQVCKSMQVSSALGKLPGPKTTLKPSIPVRIGCAGLKPKAPPGPPVPKIL